MKPRLVSAIEAAIHDATGQPFVVQTNHRTSGGCINDAEVLVDGDRRYFVKLNNAEALDMFLAEAEALDAIAATETIRAPKPIAHGHTPDEAFLVLEAIDFGAPAPGGWQKMGRQLAALHRNTAETFGWHRDNTIGSTPQINPRHTNWPDFFREARLRPQFELAQRNGFSFTGAARLLESIDDLLDGHTPAPALLHGDLWSGNASFTREGAPVIFDPASYYGDRETDLAFSEFFGGFPESFYQAYNAEWPLPPSYPDRRAFYNLYHVLNHANLFGSSYANQAQSMIKDLLGSAQSQ